MYIKVWNVAVAIIFVNVYGRKVTFVFDSHDKRPLHAPKFCKMFSLIFCSANYEYKLHSSTDIMIYCVHVYSWTAKKSSTFVLFTSTRHPNSVSTVLISCQGSNKNCWVVGCAKVHNTILKWQNPKSFVLTFTVNILTIVHFPVKSK